MPKMSIRDVSLNVKIMGRGTPLALMHGGPGANLYTINHHYRERLMASQ